MTNPTSHFNWQMPTSTDLVTDLPADFEVFGQAVDTDFQYLLGGTTGQVLAKTSGTDLDFQWVAQDDSNAIQNAIVDAKGDLISATAADTPARLAVGANNTVLTADSAEATGLKWATPSTVSVAIFNETQAAGTEGGTSTTGSFVKRTLNTTVVNNITSCTLTSSVISLPAGTYEILAFAPVFNSNNQKARLRNTTASTDLLIGQSGFCAAQNSANSFIQGSFVLTATSNIELQQRVASASSSNGYGVASNFGVSEIYSSIEITKVA